ncbi:MAG: general secretion pathway protein GspB [Gammaproteobacteria bacterium]|nr:general secretion pathway protein GspB [Gammaproteobacteria bacterium]MBU1553236.1 general secretion pathway protein GspB [Gammaproteobacteria bacterium]MBU2069025.1 general secretion pathway protein GspB [Gammaproteobacteria bacterium]MBU2183248.1 general secretion pathway protein GspB [Gammaproteobacteria bacterium]MBU2204627.1 general secretion pathway protein GspB [Gammaproteobacteria bacterium]
MSILMDALKQQSSIQPAVSDTAAFWRKLALILALLVSLLSGVLLAYWLQSGTVQPQPNMAIVAEPAKPADILAVLQQPSTPAVTTTTAPAETVKQQEVLLPETPVKRVTAADSDPLPDEDQSSEENAAQADIVADMAVSDELRDKFSQALKATEHGSGHSAVRSHTAPAQDISMLDARLLQQIPPLRFDAHVYATSAAQRWVKVNGKTLQEGQWVTADIRIREITPQYVLLQLGTQMFSMSALSEWPST